MEQSQVQFGRTTIPYTIHRAKRQKTVAVAVDPVEGVLVRAPASTETCRLDEIVHRKAKWILDRRRRQEDVAPRPTPREFVSGETFRYLGRQYRIKLVPAAARRPGSVSMRAGFLEVAAPRGASTAQIRSGLVMWYRARASARLPERANRWAYKTGLVPSSVLIRDQQKRWGSADTEGNLRLNWRIIQAPPRLLDYVVAHELIHLRRASHSREFWAELGQVMPDYQERREGLRTLGPELVW